MLFRHFLQGRLLPKRKCGLIKIARRDSLLFNSRQKVASSLNNWQMLVEGLLEEDRLLRGRLTHCPKLVREVRGADGVLSFKETLGHIAFWDNFTVEFFSHKLDRASLDPAPLVNFEERSNLAMKTAASLPFGEVLARYLEATGALTSFLGQHWAELTARERQDFWVPLKHRRHHRVSLFKALDEMSNLEEMTAEA